MGKNSFEGPTHDDTLIDIDIDIGRTDAAIDTDLLFTDTDISLKTDHCDPSHYGMGIGMSRCAEATRVSELFEPSVPGTNDIDIGRTDADIDTDLSFTDTDISEPGRRIHWGEESAGGCSSANEPMSCDEIPPKSAANMTSSIPVVCERHIYTDYMIAASKAVRASGKHNKDGVRMPVRSNFNINYLRQELHDYEDSEIVEYLEFGFPISHDGRPTNTGGCPNHTGATQFKQEIETYIDRELKEKSAIGPLHKDELGIPLTVSPLNSVDKRDSSERRVILDLSFPPGCAVNEGISKREYLGSPIHVVLPGVDDLVELIKLKGQGCAIFKRDLKRAYRQIPVDPGDIHLLGYKWGGGYFVDVTLAMGLRSAAYICQRVANMLSFLLRKHGVSNVYYLDDMAAAEDWSSAEQAFNDSEMVLARSGARENTAKCVQPSTRMPFVGVLCDTQSLTLEITPERLTEIKTLLTQWASRENCNLKELQQLVGKLNFVASCVRPACIFMACLYALLKGVDQSQQRIVNLTSEFRKDIAWWATFLDSYNGVSMMMLEEWGSPDEILA